MRTCGTRSREEEKYSKCARFRILSLNVVVVVVDCCERDSTTAAVGSTTPRIRCRTRTDVRGGAGKKRTRGANCLPPADGRQGPSDRFGRTTLARRGSQRATAFVFRAHARGALIRYTTHCITTAVVVVVAVFMWCAHARARVCVEYSVRSYTYDCSTRRHPMFLPTWSEKCIKMPL
jgi:hypothetical protein